MSQCNRSTYDESQFDDGLDEESVILTLVPVSEEPTTELSAEPIISSTVGLGQPGIVKNPPLPTSAKIKPSSPKPSSCLPAILPPINDVSRNTLREWCRHCNLSTDGKKIEVYLRLQRHSYSKQQIASVKIMHIPDTSLAAKLRPKKHKEITRGSRPQNVKKRKEDEEDGVVEVLTSERDSVFAAWGRIAMKASQPRAMNCQPLPSGVKAFLPPASGKTNNQVWVLN
ncbi:developmental pluripotency-associated protein 2 [Sigmodon hispidus]